MAWGFNNDEELRTYLKKVLEKDTNDSIRTPDWMEGLNVLYKDYPNVDNSYRDKLLEDGVDVNKYNPLLEYMLEHDPDKLDNYSFYIGKYKGIDLSPVKDRLNEIMKARREENVRKDKERQAKNNQLLKSIGYNTRKDVINFIRRYNEYVDDSVTDDMIWRSEYYPEAIKILLGKAHDKEAMKRGIKYPQLKFGNNDYLEDYLVDDYGNPIEDAFDNNFSWFKNKFGPEIPEYSVLEDELKKVLAQHRADLSQRNIVKALAPDEDGGLF